MRPGVDLWVGQFEQLEESPLSLAQDDLLESGTYLSTTARKRFLLARSALRVILSTYLQLPPATIGLRRGRHGKPRLAPGQGRLHFNLSHSGPRLAVAVSSSGPLGLDIEQFRPIDAPLLARHWFSPAEHSAWLRLPSSIRHEAFFHLWCRKEAFLKATGLGLALPLHTFTVSADPDRARLLSIRGRSPRRWTLSGLDAGSGCAGALVTRGLPGPIVRKELT